MKERERILRAFDYLEETINKSSEKQFLKDCKILGQYILEAYKENELTEMEAAVFLEKTKELADIKKNENIENTLGTMNISEVFSQMTDAFIEFSKDFYIELRKGIKDLRIFLKKLEYNMINEYGTPCVTIDGVVVRSRGEKKIGDFLCKNSIKYEYDPLIKGGLRELKEENPMMYYNVPYDNMPYEYWEDKGTAKMLKEPIPDFYLPEYDIYIEYWGLKENKSYQKRMREKKRFYKENNIPIINLYPENLNNIGYAFKKEFKKAKGYEFPDYLKYPK